VDRATKLAERAVARIGSGALDKLSVDALAAELGVSERHLRRAVIGATGVAPLELAATRRLGIAKALLQDTGLPITEVAFASGFASLRRFHDAFRARFGCAPSTVRKARPSGLEDRITLRLDARPPYAGARLLEFLRGRAIAGVESVREDGYRRTAEIDGRVGEIDVCVVSDAERPHVLVRVEASLLPSLPEVLVRVRSVFDLDARPDVIDAHLSRDAVLAPRVAQNPGLRVPGAWDPWELAVRAILGQQVSVKAATTLSGRLVERFGRASGGRMLFPSAMRLASATPAEIGALGLPASRAATLSALAKSVAASDVVLDRFGEPDQLAQKLTSIAGIGPWTAGYVILRALRDPDAFLPGDLGVRKAMSARSERDAEARSQAWRPWRAYALMHLWVG
jgi:AraC family transcriptional regulator of adaptative response / DNA-3-methyladenine glycosylase II